MVVSSIQFNRELQQDLASKGRKRPRSKYYGGYSEEGTCTPRRVDSALQQHTDVELSILRTLMKEFSVV